MTTHLICLVHFALVLFFDQEIFCNLTKYEQRESSSFQCGHFKNRLRVAEQPILEGVNDENPEVYFDNFNLSMVDPDKISSNLRFHFCFNTYSRRQLFDNASTYIENCLEWTESFSRDMEREVSFIHLATDHIHFTMNLGVDDVPLDIATKARDMLEHRFLCTYPNLNCADKVWEKQIFINTLS